MRIARARRLIEIGAAALVGIAALPVRGPARSPRSARMAIRLAAINLWPGLLICRTPTFSPSTGWGGYAISRLSLTGGRLVVDGRNDMYNGLSASSRTTRTLRGADPGWQSLAARYGLEAMLFPPGAPITKGPATDAGWCETDRNDAEVLLVPCP